MFSSLHPAPLQRRAKKSKYGACMKRKIHRTKGMAKKKRRNQRRQIISRAPTTARQYYAMPDREQEIWDSLAHVISRVRDGQSLRKASKESGLAASMVVELGRPALRKKNGRYIVTKTDRLLRIVSIVTANA